MKVSRRILVRGPNYLGDHVMARAFYAQLPTLFPDAEFTLLVPPALTALKPRGFTDTLALDRRRPWHFARRVLRPRRFDLAISLPASLSSALLLCAAEIPERVGFAETVAKIFFTRSLKWPGVSAGQPKGELYRQLVSRLGGDPRAATGPGEFENCDGVPDRQNRILIAPGASLALREWPYFPELAEALRARRPGYEIAIVGAATESAWADKFSPAFTNLIGKTTLPELVQLCRASRLVIGNDSGVAHLAAALAETPTLALFGPGNPAYVSPMGPRVAIARIDLPCSPCESAVCRNRPRPKQCLVDLDGPRVLERALELLPREE